MHILSAHEVSFSYPEDSSGKLVLDKVNLQVRSDERVSLDAPSGVGKTTLCKLLAGYLSPKSGTVTLDDESLDSFKGCCPVQMIWQHPEKALDPRLRMSASLEEAGNVKEELIEGLGIRPEWMTRFPRELSGGELQRFCIARALSVGPRFLIADEISTMLDAVTQAQIWVFIQKWCEAHDCGLVFVSHNESLVERIATRAFKL